MIRMGRPGHALLPGRRHIAWRADVRDLKQVRLVSQDGDAAGTPLTGFECDHESCSQLMMAEEGSKPIASPKGVDYAEGELLVEDVESRSTRPLQSAYNRGKVHANGQAGIDAIAEETMTGLGMPVTAEAEPAHVLSRKPRAEEVVLTMLVGSAAAC